MIRRKIVAGNWKMNLTLSDAEALASELGQRLSPATHGVEVAVFPSFPWLQRIRALLAESPVEVGAQNLYFEESGAFTGEVSPSTVAEFATAVIVGHSERRHIFLESDELISKKVEAALRHHLTTYLCIGEQLEDRRAGNAESVVTDQLRADLGRISVADCDGLVIAYEPVWAIGTGESATAIDAQQMSATIRRWLEHRFDEPTAANTRVLYGGSVAPENARSYFTQPDVDGALVGGACLDADSFVSIIESAALAARV